MGAIASIGVKPFAWRPWLRAALSALYEMVPRKATGELSVQKSVAVGQKASATLLRVNGEQLLLGVTATSVSLLRKWRAGNPELEVRGVVQ